MHIGSMPVSQVRGVYNQSNRLVNSLFHYHSKPHLFIKQSNLHNKPTPPPQPQQSQCLALTALTPLTPSTTPRVCLSYIFTFLPSHHLSMHEMPSGTSFDHIYLLSSPSPYIPPIPPQFHQKTNTQSSPFEGPGGCPQRRRGQAPQQRPRHRCLQHWQLRLHEAVARHRPIKGPRRHPEGRSQGSRGGPSREHPPHQLSMSETC